jgi:hypothetical protein
MVEGYRTEAEQAARLGKKPRTLALWRKLGIGPRYVRFGNSILYSFDAETEFLKSKEVAPVRSRSRRMKTAEVCT